MVWNFSAGRTDADAVGLLDGSKCAIGHEVPEAQVQRLGPLILCSLLLVEFDVDVQSILQFAELRFASGF